MDAYSVACGKFLFSADYVTTSLSSIESRFATDNGLSLRGSGADFAADLGNGVPVVHGV